MGGNSSRELARGIRGPPRFQGQVPSFALPLLPRRLAGFGVAAGLALALAASFPSHASAASATGCSVQKRAARIVSVKRFKRQIRPARAAFFRKHGSARARHAFRARPAAEAHGSEARRQAVRLRWRNGGSRSRSRPRAATLLAVALLRPLHGDERRDDQHGAPAPAGRPDPRGHALRGLPGPPFDRVDEHALRPAGSALSCLVRRGLVWARPDSTSPP